MTLCDLIDALTKFRGMLRGFSFTVIQRYLKCERLIFLSAKNCFLLSGTFAL